MKRNVCTLLLVNLISITSCTDFNNIDIFFDENSPVLSYGFGRLSQQFDKMGYTLKKTSEGNAIDNGIIILKPEYVSIEKYQEIINENLPGIYDEGYRILKRDGRIFILGTTDDGCLYGMMDLIEQLRSDPDLNNIKERHENPALSFRAIKFNLPWSAYSLL